MPRVSSHPTGQPIWFDLQTSNAAAARAFYAAVLGWTYEEQAPEYGGYAVAFNDGAVAAGIGQQEPGAAFRPGYRRLPVPAGEGIVQHHVSHRQPVGVVCHARRAPCR